MSSVGIDWRSFRKETRNAWQHCVVPWFSEPTACVLTLQVHLHLFAILIYYCPITNEFFWYLN